ncbi:uncharacterized protein PHALS_13998 [Plasmopara halstedii]|uniref:Uncharacterized protein n=1 Tax=Plasmopara halstedii TaxID=4781 RepID=A0A0P1AQA5_PLAHL|nr:uncharacterized protein PHALS_13998 [Plasmopara halstedii]CEG43704.1 hypothetical protein PHALS_13998 [Plasmopara halstedii]|eukprot:XP_024580073.1 hypothetical protein PHALS_13998 [Plasmopara halstedii]
MGYASWTHGLNYRRRTPPSTRTRISLKPLGETAGILFEIASAANIINRNISVRIRIARTPRRTDCVRGQTINV